MGACLSGIALAISALIGMIWTDGTGSLVNVGLDMYNGATSFSLIAIPMFVLAGAIMNAAGITKRLIAFVSAMIGGGIIFIDDKARGVHEGYLVTPITKLEMVLGLNVAGAIKAILAGCTLVILGSLIAGLGSSFQP